MFREQRAIGRTVTIERIRLLIVRRLSSIVFRFRLRHLGCLAVVPSELSHHELMLTDCGSAGWISTSHNSRCGIDDLALILMSCVLLGLVNLGCRSEMDFARSMSVSLKVGCGWIDSVKSRTLQPISMASTASAINSPAPDPTMPKTSTR